MMPKTCNYYICIMKINLYQTLQTSKLSCLTKKIQTSLDLLMETVSKNHINIIRQAKLKH